VLELLPAARKHADGNLWITALATGAHLSELQGLTWADVDGDHVRITRSLQYVDRVWMVLPPKTRRRRRERPLVKAGVEALRRERQRQAEWRLQMGSRWSIEFGDLVFTNPLGRPRNGPAVTKRLQATLLLLGLPAVGMIGLRRSTASLLALASVPPRVAMSIMGHSQFSTTMDVYAKTFDSSLMIAADALERALNSED
jgi:integrase